MHTSSSQLHETATRYYNFLIFCLYAIYKQLHETVQTPPPLTFGLEVRPRRVRLGLLGGLLALFVELSDHLLPSEARFAVRVGMRFTHDRPVLGVLVMSGKLNGVSRGGVKAHHSVIVLPSVKLAVLAYF